MKVFAAYFTPWHDKSPQIRQKSDKFSQITTGCNTKLPKEGTKGHKAF